MKSLFRKWSSQRGLPPGTLVYVGDEKKQEVRIQAIDYNEESIREMEIKEVSECLPLKQAPSVTWINVDGIHKMEVLEELGKLFHIHPLTLEDIVNTTQRPKLEDYESYIYVTLKMLQLESQTREIKVEQIGLILLEGCVITFQERPGDVFDPIRKRIKGKKGVIRKMGPDYLAYSLIDAIVDHYFSILEYFDETAEEMEESLMDDSTSDMLQEIHNTRREIITLRKAVWPLRDLINTLHRLENPLFSESIKLYLRDVYDHTIQVIDTVETFRELISGLHDLNLSIVSNKMNEVMKILTIIATIFIPLSFVTGIYGMNFDRMPELHFKGAYPAVLIIMFLIVVLMLSYFRKKKWL